MAFPLVGVTVRHLHLTVANAVMMITEESHYFSGGSMSKLKIKIDIYTKYYGKAK